MELDDNLEYAMQAIIYARSLIKQSATLLDESRPEYVVPEKLSLVHEEIVKMRQSTHDAAVSMKCLFRVPDARLNADVVTIKHNVKRVKKFAVGNCGEYALLALNKLRKLDVKCAERYSIHGDDHAFVVIGRKEGSTPDRPETWGLHAVVCDPWAGKVYPASEIKDNLSCFSGIGGRNAYPFDPMKHTLQVDNYIGGKDPEIKNSAMDEAISKLKLFRRSLEELSINKRDIELRNIIGQLEQNKKDDTFRHVSNMYVERYVSKIVLKQLNLAIDAANLPCTSKAFHDKLLDGWLKLFDAREKTIPMIKLASIGEALLIYDDTVSLPLIDKITDELLRHIILTRRTLNSSGSYTNILETCLIRTDISENKFVSLCSRLSQEALSVESESCVTTINGSCSSYLHLAAALKRPHCFHALLDKHSQASLLRICKLTISDLQLPNYALNLLGAESFVALINKLPAEMAIQEVNKTLKTVTSSVPDLFWSNLIEQLGNIQDKDVRHECMAFLKLYRNDDAGFPRDALAVKEREFYGLGGLINFSVFIGQSLPDLVTDLSVKIKFDGLLQSMSYDKEKLSTWVDSLIMPGYWVSVLDRALSFNLQGTDLQNTTVAKQKLKDYFTSACVLNKIRKELLRFKKDPTDTALNTWLDSLVLAPSWGHSLCQALGLTLNKEDLQNTTVAKQKIQDYFTSACVVAKIRGVLEESNAKLDELSPPYYVKKAFEEMHAAIVKEVTALETKQINMASFQQNIDEHFSRGHLSCQGAARTWLELISNLGNILYEICSLKSEERAFQRAQVNMKYRMLELKANLTSTESNQNGDQVVNEGETARRNRVG